MIPCPSALVLLLSAIALQQTTLGLLLVSSFSLKLVSVLSALGLATVYTRDGSSSYRPCHFCRRCVTAYLSSAPLLRYV
ncbi:hypothetical protein [Acaryochloris sp. CCMEE 5410]|uniref:hypothetical protein n=1 Tax=Acaryochloris sp. CCMEE 5410 TaxID=310037 RepID=UPI0002484CDB|nr:hypothetical protein [Acaryochloris sp. CCMEE 5410]KAI9129071.1 hypothetical protein ON05_036815 [Acaryochloris sp. CCMEE 5410]